MQTVDVSVPCNRGLRGQETRRNYGAKNRRVMLTPRRHSPIGALWSWHCADEICGIMEPEMNMPQQQSDSLGSHQRMQCMEVWGGNRQVDRYLETPGLEAWIYSQPHEQAPGGGDVYYIPAPQAESPEFCWPMSAVMAWTHLSWQ